MKIPYYRISLAFSALFFSHVAKATLLHQKTKTAQRYATPALTNIGEQGLSYNLSGTIAPSAVFSFNRESGFAGFSN